MPRQSATSVENNFRQGYITEASGLNFPENACTETENCVFNFDGSVVRRYGFDFEPNYVEKTINRAGSVVTAYLWKNVAGDGDVTLLVVQVGATLYFYKTDNSTISAGALTTTVALSAFLASGATNPETHKCQFASGNGHLFVTHPNCDPFYVAYDTATTTATGTIITLKIRDIEGDTADPYAVDERPTATLPGLDVHHKYNLYNQGWTTTNLTTWDGAFTGMPSNVDVMFAFKNSSDAFDTATAGNTMEGNSPAPKGHFILSLSNQDRATVSGVAGATSTTSGTSRPTTCAWFAGRVFYAGIQYNRFNTSLYFSQIIERVNQYGLCYQNNDPTAEDASDLLASDGGVVRIQEAGTIYKLVSIIGALVVFAANGVWVITGSTGAGFSAVDFTVQKISTIATNSATSFVDVGGLPAWWNSEGIYTLTAENGSFGVQSLSHSKIRSFYSTIPAENKLNATGFFNPITGVIQWLYRSEVASTPEEICEYDRILNYHTFTGAFFVWTISDSSVKVNALVVLEGVGSSLGIDQIVDDAGDIIVTDAGENVVAYTFGGAAQATPIFKYIVSRSAGGSYKFTLAEASNNTYLDWVQFGDLTDYTSYFVTGYKIHGEGLRNWQANYVTLFSRNDVPTAYFIQGLWSYATSGNSGRWTSRQLISHDNENYGVLSYRVKLRGWGLALQYKVTSVSGYPFDLLGWSTFETANATP